MFGSAEFPESCKDRSDMDNYSGPNQPDHDDSIVSKLSKVMEDSELTCSNKVSMDKDGAPRVKKYTERGLHYTVENKERLVNSKFAKLKIKTEEMRGLIHNNDVDSPVQKEHKNWLVLYSDYLEAHDEYSKILSSKEREEYNTSKFESRDIYLTNFKSAVESWLCTNAKEKTRQSSISSIRSHRTKSSSYVSSSVAHAKIIEEQRKAELLARASALKQQQELEMRKLKLSQEEESLKLQTEIAVSDARNSVLDSFEQQSVNSNHSIVGLNDCLNNVQGITYAQQSNNVKCVTGLNVISSSEHSGVKVISDNRQNVDVTLHDNVDLNDRFDNVQGTTEAQQSNNIKGITGIGVTSGSEHPSINVISSAKQNKGVISDSTENVSVISDSIPNKGVTYDSKLNAGIISNSKPNKGVISDSRENIGVTSNGKQQIQSVISDIREQRVSDISDNQNSNITSVENVNNQSLDSSLSSNSRKGDNFVRNATVGGDSVVSNCTFCHDASRRSQPRSSHDVPLPSSDFAMSVVQHLRKPSSEIKPFSGAVLEYRKFIRQFKAVVEANSDDFDERLHYLEQFTSGEPNRIVLSCSYLDARQGYESAVRELEERYGDMEVVANAFIRKALNWPIIKADKPKQLDEFAIFLSECENAIRSIDAVKVLEYSENMKQIIRKLPYYLHDKWRNIVQQTKERGQSVVFSQLVKLVKCEAKRANDPTYGRMALSQDTKDGRAGGNTNSLPSGNRQYKAKGSFAASWKNEKPNDSTSDAQRKKDVPQAKSCMFCKEQSHFIDSCPKFLNVTIKDRVDFVKSNGMCFGCFKLGHRSKECRNKAKCSKCQRFHPTLLHNDDYVRNQNNENTEPKTSAFASRKCNDASDGDCTMAIIPVKVKMSNSVLSVETYAFLDPGSSVTFCSDVLAQQIGASGKGRKITIDTMGVPHTMKTNVINGIEISDLSETNTIQLPSVYTKQSMPVSKSHIATQEDLSPWPHLSDVYLPTIKAEIGLLIGNNVPDVYTPLDIRTGPTGSPHASRTRMGWIAWNVVRDGVSSSYPVNRADVIAVEEIERLNQLDKLIQSSINLDFPERIKDERKEDSQQDKQFMNRVNESIQFSDGHYYIGLPFKCDNAILPNNYEQASLRLRSLKKRLIHSSNLCEDYKEFMKNILDKGYAEVVPDKELNRNDGRVWYIPHHAVYHPRKPGKIRVVFDCAAIYQGTSLNKLLLQGPDLTNKLIGVLTRFRQGPIALMSDIESMFYQVRVPRNDCDCLRFLWWPNGDVSEKPIVYRMLVHLFGSVSSPACANMALRQTVEDNEEKYNSTVTQTMLRNFYVDDCLKSLEDEESAINLVYDLISLCQDGGFHLTKWISNKKDVIGSIPNSERSKNIKDLCLEHDNLPQERALGVFWMMETDSFGFKIQLQSRETTRRGILSIVSSIYDPLGLASPFILPAKIILQNLCKEGVGWDDNITGVYLQRWQEWLDSLPFLETLYIPRCFKPSSFGNVVSCQVHNFSDASDVGYGIVSYIRLIDDSGSIHCSLLTSKARVAPLKRITTPRMELTAAALAVRISNMVLRELEFQVDNVFYWTDSMSVLRYVRNETARFHTFVANRVAVIRDGSEVSQWNYVSTSSNPADDVSRGLSMKNISRCQRWVNGPEFLQRPEQDWKESYVVVDQDISDDPEVKNPVNAAVCEVTGTAVERLLSHYSDWIKLKRAVSWILMVKDHLYRQVQLKRLSSVFTESECKDDKSKGQRQPGTKKVDTNGDIKPLSVEILERAECAIISYTQRKHFETEIDQVKRNVGIKKSSRISRLDPNLLDGVLRVGGRLDEAIMTFNAKHPCILPKESPVSKLIIREVHKSVGHFGKSAILASLRQKYWILGANSIIKDVVSKCVVCRKYKAKVCSQKMSDLPPERITPEEPPFTKVGMDYFGPFEIKRGRSVVKRYGVIFTCLATRAVHLEVSYALDTDSCINSIRRFIARRGQVKFIRSDNGTNLVGARRELQEEIDRMNTDKIDNELKLKNIDWRFNPPAGSHFGGIWERMIRSVRKILYSLLQDQPRKLDDEALQTLFCEIESILNSRPITTVSNDVSDLEALTPNHLLLLQPGEHLPCGVFDKNDNCARRRWRQIQYLSDIFWKRWIKEYLPLMQERQKWVSAQRNVSVGDIVFVVDSGIRKSYTLGRVLEVFPDKKGLVRIVKVKTKTTTLKRPVDKLCVIVEA